MAKNPKNQRRQNGPSDGTRKWAGIQAPGYHPPAGMISRATLKGAFATMNEILVMMRQHDRPREFKVTPGAFGDAIADLADEYLNWVFHLRYSTIEGRKLAGDAEFQRPGKGNKMQAAPLLMRFILFLKTSQCAISNPGTSRYNLVERYQKLEPELYHRKPQRDGLLQDLEYPIDAATCFIARRALPKTHALRLQADSDRIAAILTSLIIREEEVQKPNLRVCRSLKTRWIGLKKALETHLGTDRGLEILIHFFNFSQHTDAELLRMLKTLKPEVERPVADRLAELDHLMAGEHAALADQLAPLLHLLSR